MKKLLTMAVALVASVLLVGNVSALEQSSSVSLNENDVVYGGATATISDGRIYKQETVYSYNTTTGRKTANSTIVLGEISAPVIDYNNNGANRPVDNAAWIGVVLDADLSLIGDAATVLSGKYNIVKTYNGKEVASDDMTFYVPIQVSDLEGAMKKNGILEKVATIVWTVKSKTDDTVYGTFTQNVTLRINAGSVTLTDARTSAQGKKDTTLWSYDIAMAHAEFAADQTPATDESKKDDVPKTGNVFPMALVGMMTVGAIAGISFKKCEE